MISKEEQGNEPRPAQWSREKARAFEDASVVLSYEDRPPYPVALFDELLGLCAGRNEPILDVGCGSGDVARSLALRGAEVEALDASAKMIERGRELPGGDCRNIRWVHSRLEAASLGHRYSLITAGESVHWMEWGVVMPLLASVLIPGGKLALVRRAWGTGVEAEAKIYAQHSTSPDFRFVDVAEELERRGLFCIEGEKVFVSSWTPTIAEYISSRHSQSMFSTERMGKGSARVFDAALQSLLNTLCEDGVLVKENGRLQHNVRTTLCWGEPRSGS